MPKSLIGQVKKRLLKKHASSPSKVNQSKDTKDSKDTMDTKKPQDTMESEDKDHGDGGEIK